jgi:hypothetical protein
LKLPVHWRRSAALRHRSADERAHFCQRVAHDFGRRGLEPACTASAKVDRANLLTKHRALGLHFRVVEQRFEVVSADATRDERNERKANASI